MQHSHSAALWMPISSFLNILTSHKRGMILLKLVWSVNMTGHCPKWFWAPKHVLIYICRSYIFGILLIIKMMLPVNKFVCLNIYHYYYNCCWCCICFPETIFIIPAPALYPRQMNRLYSAEYFIRQHSMSPDWTLHEKFNT